MAAKRITGTIVSNKMQKTVVVEVTRLYKHPRYKKLIRRKKKFYAHCEQEIQEGNKVVIEECRPLSKLKRWRVVEIL
ncbi:30S ribosomal protein S17 [Patescibacteria group bacterium]|nr:30S ribosomal protein S17 [Patescibacteria group bacterium]MBU1867877.1 30S ribosomal protein S17 [Patescibacteria group bacterium]